MRLQELRPAPGSKKRPKRVGCGRGSGHGKTCTRGAKGQGSRSGSRIRPGFEGGQMPLYRRIPKRGFKSPNHRIYCLVNLDTIDSNFKDGEKIDKNAMLEKKIIRDIREPVKILGRGEISKKVYIEADAFSKSARELIEKAGGEIKKI